MRSAMSGWIVLGICLSTAPLADEWPLHAAARSGDIERLRERIALGDDLNARDPADSTPLHVAAMSGSAELVRVLVESGADVGAIDGSGQTPLHLAPPAIVGLIIAHGADVNAADKRGTTALHTAVRGGSTEAVRQLILAGSNVNPADVSGATPSTTPTGRSPNCCFDSARTFMRGTLGEPLRFTGSPREATVRRSPPC